MTKEQLKRRIRAISPWLTLRQIDDEIRVSVSIPMLQDTFSYTYAEALARNESLAAFVYDADEAVAAARMLAVYVNDAREDRNMPIPRPSPAHPPPV